MHCFLDDIDRIDWNDFSMIRDVAQGILHRIAGDKPFLRDLVFNVGSDASLFGKCERHELLDKLVLYDDLARGMRLRLHISTPVHSERPHDHRFSFASLILRGAYRHVFFQSAGNDHVEASVNDTTPMFISQENRGSFYLLHHSVLHTTYTTPDTVSLFLRGPATKEHSIIVHRDTGEIVWREGEAAETPERRQEVAMSVPEYRQIRDRLELLGLI